MDASVITGNAAAAANPSVGTNGAPAPTSSTEVGGIDNSGNLVPLQLDASGNLKVTAPAGSATAANQVLEIAALNSIDSKTPALGQAAAAASSPVVIAFNQSAVPVSGPLTDVQLRATAVPVSGPLTDAQLRATPVPVSGTVTTTGLTDTQLRASPVPISGTVTANTGLSQPLTDAQLRATPVPISGTVATGGLTDTQLRATAVPVSGPLTDTQLRATPVPVSGTVAVSNLSSASAFSTAVVALTAATPTIIFSANASRLSGLVQNNSSAPIWLGGSSVSNSGVNTGISILPGTYTKWENTAALYGYSVSGASIVAMEET